MGGELLAFESSTFDPAKFDHAAHVEMAFALLQKTTFLDAAQRYSETIAALARRVGKPEKYNLTITVAFLSVIAERITRMPGVSWTQFIDANPDLLDSSLLERWYDRDRLADPLARGIFLMPAPQSKPNARCSEIILNDAMP
jgi:hypothetical protein